MNKAGKTNNSANEAVKSSPSKGNIPEYRTIVDSLCKRHNALARYVGVPCTIEPQRITRYPAILEEHGAYCRGFGGYRIPLAPFRDEFNKIRFRGMGNGKQVVCGYVIDKNGYVESFVRMPGEDGWAILPITPDSHALFASVPLVKGKPAWDDIHVQLYGDSLTSEMGEAITALAERVTALEQTLYRRHAGSADC